MLFRVAVLLAFATMLAFAQQTAPASVDVGEEPKHHLVFQNDFVRAFEVTVPVGTETLIHRHTKPYVYVSIGDADVRNEVVGKDPMTIYPKDGEVKFVQGGFAHKAANVGKTDFRNVTVELLKTSDATADPKKGTIADVLSNPAETVLFEHGWISRSNQLAPRTTTMIPNSRRNYALIAVSDLDLTTSAERPANPPIQMRAGEVKWFAGGVAQEWRNRAATPARYVVLQLLAQPQ